MIVPFSTHWPKTMPEHMAGKPTHFTEKIWATLILETEHSISDYEKYDKEHYKRFNKAMSDYKELLISGKGHTIRADQKDRWKPGRDIHFVINNRSKNQFQFAPVIKCVSTQRIFIHRADGINKHLYSFMTIDNKHVDDKTLERLVKNDGFDCVEDFFAWFSEDFTGKIIHWTNLKY